jgi:hypothetical protein
LGLGGNQREGGGVVLVGERGNRRMTTQWRKKMMTSGAHASVTGEGSCSKVYVFGYTCNWAHVRFIRIPWHFCGNQRIAMVYFKIGEL